MIHEKNLKLKILWHCPFKENISAHKNALMSQNFIKILSLETIFLKSRVNGFLKRKIQEFIFFQYRVFTKSIFTHPFLKHFHRKNSIYKIPTPASGVKEETAEQTAAAKLFLFAPIPAKAKKLGLLSIYKFSLGKPISTRSVAPKDCTADAIQYWQHWC